MGQHDLSYRSFFAHRRMIEDLLREIVGERWVERIDFDSGERVDTSFVTPKHENRESDVIWQFRRKDGGEPIYVYVLLEFQSRPDPSMPVRLMVYVSLFYQRLMSGQPAAGWRKLPLVIPVVVYNGGEPWNVATDLGSLIGELDPSAEIRGGARRLSRSEQGATEHRWPKRTERDQRIGIESAGRPSFFGDSGDGKREAGRGRPGSWPFIECK